ncbi:MAG TPA: hypothetical protein PLR50_11735 [Candidatus Rifleibacterium sp.]|nr:hypothetical protein [Candidatus Rifleibacterium sp.]HPW57655.1 hypothetical protein [Candidatus Rifleibacterium sp.]HQB84160.1 hypothetical protein [Candidatus Rifleibacterium sp.]
MTREEIIARFEKYDFRDSQGHPLINCLDFQMLIDQAITDADQVKQLERHICRGKPHATPDGN